MTISETQSKITRSAGDVWARIGPIAARTPVTNWEQAAERYLPRIGAVLCLVVMTGLIFRVLLIPTHFSVWAYGDAQMFNAGVHFAHEGFFAHYFLPEIDPGNPHSFIANNGPNGRYAHYPALHGLLNGVLIYVGNRLGLTDIVQLKQFLQVVYLLIVAVGLLGYFGALKRISGTLVATLFTVFLVSSPWVVGFGDSLCDQALNIALLGAFLLVVVKRFEAGTPRGFSPWIALLVFLLSRNSIELLPLCLVFTLFYGVVMNVVNGLALRRIALFYASSIVGPIAVGLTLQFFQSYLDFGSRELFFSHWNVVFTSRVGVRGYDVLHLGQYWMTRLHDSWMLLGLLALFVALFVAGTAERNAALRRSVMQKSGFPLALALGFLAFPLAMPLQALVMQSYTTAYIYIPTILLALALTLTSGPSWWNWLPDVTGRFVPVTRLLSGCVALVAIYSSVTAGGLALLVDPLSVTSPTDFFWALTTFDRQKIAYYAQPEIRGVIAQYTRPTDILLFPFEFHGGDPHEVNPIIEFYTQRHGVIVSEVWTVDYICGVVAKDRARLEGRWKAYLPPSLFVVPDTTKNISIEDFARGLTTAWAPACG